jgi:glycosyl hydrolase family 2
VTTARHVIFGTGAIGLATLDALQRRGETVRMVNRSGHARVSDDVEVIGGDARDPAFTTAVARGASVIYQTLNPPYHQWTAQSRALQTDVVAAARDRRRPAGQHGEHLYVRTPRRPHAHRGPPRDAHTTKGQLHSRMSRELLAAHHAGRVKVAIGRASDYFGPRGGPSPTSATGSSRPPWPARPPTVLGDPTSHTPTPTSPTSAKDPYLYQVHTTLQDNDSEIDSAVARFGVRTLRVDPQHGLRINGETVKLRGACLHHDNGPLGAAAFGRAEERRIEILKSAGFNAIRSAHNPVSPAMLDACDRLGMLVLDEAFDMWLEAMKPFDYSLDFPEWWERDIEAMVAKDVNHPSVIMYSIGNEIPETGSGLGASWGRDLAEKVRSLDQTRFITNAISGFWAVSAEILNEFRQEVSALQARGVNNVMNELTATSDRITTSELVTQRTPIVHKG